MKNQLQLATLTFILVLSIIKIDAQKMKFEISLPLISHQTTNIQALRNDFNKSYDNDSYIPNFRFTAKYVRFISGIEYYKHTQFANKVICTEYSTTDINLNVNSISVLLGYELLNLNSFSINLGSGLTYHKPYLVFYFENYIIEGYPYPVTNKFGALFWLSASKRIYKNFNIGLNLRYNPMFKSFYDVAPNRGDIYGHDRLNYFISQVSIGYQI